MRRVRNLVDKWSCALAGMLVWVVGSGYAQDRGLIPDIPSYLDRLATSMSAALFVLVIMRRMVEPIANAYRLGLTHGQREQRRRCEIACNHTHGAEYPTGAYPVVEVGGEPFAQHSPTQLATVTPIRVREQASN